MRRLFSSILLVSAIASSVLASETNSVFPPSNYTLPDGLVLHGWSAGDNALKRINQRIYGLDLGIDNDITKITSTKTNPIIKARYRYNKGLYISGEGPTWILPDIQTAFSTWYPLPIDEKGTSLPLDAVRYFDSNLGGDDPLTKVFPNLTSDQIYAAAEAFKKNNDGHEIHPEFVSLCATSLSKGGGYCNPFVQQTELEVYLKNTAPVVIIFNYIPGC